MANSNSQSPLVKFLLIAEVAVAVYLVGKALVTEYFNRSDRHLGRPIPEYKPKK